MRQGLALNGRFADQQGAGAAPLCSPEIITIFEAGFGVNTRPSIAAVQFGAISARN